MRIEKIDWKLVGVGTVALWLVGFGIGRAGADVLWSRLRGRVKAVNYKTAALTIQDKAGDLITLKIDDDVQIFEGKDVKALKDVSIDDRVVLINAPRGPKPKDQDEPPSGGVYK